MSDDVIGGSTKTVQHLIKNISRYIRAMFRRCHSVSFVMYISDAKFEQHCSSLS